MSSETRAEWTALSGFERDLLQAAAALADEEGSTTGVALRRYLERGGYETVTHGRVYQNLTDLVARGVLERVPVDGRSYHHRPTERGRRLAREHLDAAAAAFDAEE
jgi:DNA-binding PadR family transcriptional regulator